MSTRMLASFVALVLAVSTASASCDDDTPRAAVPGGGNAAPPGIAVGGGDGSTAPVVNETAATFSLVEVTNIASVASLDEITQAQVAQQKATVAEVQAYAQQMAIEHTQALDRLRALSSDQGAQQGVAGLQVRITLDPTARVLQRHDLLVLQDLQAETGSAFDLAYMTTEIATHAKVLALFDRALLPSVVGAAVSSTGLLNELQVERDAVSRHLVQALQLQQRVRQGAIGDAGVDAGGAGGEAGLDAGLDAGGDAGVDASSDAATPAAM